MNGSLIKDENLKWSLFFHLSFFALGPCLAGPKLKILGSIHSIVRTRKRILNHFDGAQLEQLYIYSRN